MTHRLTQKHFLKGTQELEIVGDELKLRAKSPFQQALDTRIPLSVLNPEPVLARSAVSFTSRASEQVLVSLAIGKPDAASFHAFLGELKTQIARAAARREAALNGNVAEVPPEFADDGNEVAIRIKHEVRPGELEQAITMLRRHLDDADLGPFIEALEALLAKPADEARRTEVARRFSTLGIGQGAVLTYAPYLGFLLSDHPFED